MAKPGRGNLGYNFRTGWHKLAMPSNFKDAISGVLFEGLK